LSNRCRIQRSLGAAPFAHAFDDRLAVAPKVSANAHTTLEQDRQQRVPALLFLIKRPREFRESQPLLGGRRAGNPLYSTHDQDENDTRSMAALCQSLLRLRDASKAALIVVHHVRKSIGRDEIGSAFRGSSALHAVGDSYLLLTRPSAQLSATVELRFQFRYAAAPEPRLLQLDPHTLCFSAAGLAPSKAAAARKKVDQEHVTKALAGLGQQARYNQLREPRRSPQKRP
jgi:hypothetical protein